MTTSGKNAKHVLAHYGRELEHGRKKRTTTPLTDDEWTRIKELIDSLKSERKAL